MLGVDRRRRYDGDSPYLLTNFARCALCGGSMVVHSRQHGGARRHFYGCLTYWKKGRSRYANTLAARMEVLDAEVLDTLKDNILGPGVVERAIDLALQELSPTGHTSKTARSDAEILMLQAECSRLAEAIARGGRLEVLLRTLEERQRRLGLLQSERDSAQRLPAPAFDRAGLETKLRYLLEDWQGLLSRDVSDGRQVLRTLLVEPLRFTPVVETHRRGYRFEGAVALDRLVAGRVNLPTFVESQSTPSWNQILSFLQQMAQLRESAGSAA